MKKSPEQAAIDANISEIESSYFQSIPSPEKKRGNAFQYLCLSILCDLDYEDIEDEDIIDGNDEEGIDIIHHEEIDNRINVTIINCKSSKSKDYSANEITKIDKGLKYVFSESKNNYSQLKNTKLKNNISYIRNEKQKIYDVNVFYCVFNGSNLAENVNRKIVEIKTWFSKYFQDQFRKAKFDFHCVNSSDLFVIKNKNKESLRDVEIELDYYDKDKKMRPEVKVQNGIDGYVTTFDAKEISKIVEKYGDKLFEKNIRGWLKSKNKTNIEILDSCISVNSNLFWFMNNGITIVGDEVFPDDDKCKWKIKNLQIVNGQQTARTLYEASRNGKLKEDVKIMCRVYKSDSPEFINLITKATNTQTSIGSSVLSFII